MELQSCLLFILDNFKPAHVDLLFFSSKPTQAIGLMEKNILKSIHMIIDSFCCIEVTHLYLEHFIFLSKT